MSRYIDVDTLEDICPCGYCEGCEDCRKELENVPTIDIVRCKECKHWWNEYGDSACMLHSDFTVSADDFCSYGERREP